MSRLNITISRHVDKVSKLERIHGVGDFLFFFQNPGRPGLSFLEAPHLDLNKIHKIHKLPSFHHFHLWARLSLAMGARDFRIT